MVNRAAGSVGIVFESRAQIHVSEQLPWYREVGWNREREYVRERHTANDIDIGSTIVSRDQDSFFVGQRRTGYK